MREIHFRAWQQVTKTMFYNIEKGTGAPHGNPPFADYLENANMIVMQFTEMQDSHGREIYDGDIVEIKQPFETILAQVFWGEVTNSYQWICGQTWLFCFESGAQGPVLPYLRYGYELRVIGNVYENPELITR